MVSKKKPKSDTVYIKFHLSIGLHNAYQEETIEFDRKEWESYTEEEKYREAKEWAGNYIENYFEEVEEDD